ncbi:MAG: NADPH-dependent 7-cyano-7-deazaguanine reductase QueF [Marinobacter sp.]|uniref:NADPH-dependent 7-cyano-7-deazaguanine reductase QueF n=1 Tax=Marinobacter sp. TaxID=50741 RepID=UPI00349FE4D4
MALHDAPLGKASEYPASYNPDLLFPIPRDDNRRRIGFQDGRWPWFGEDLWQAWELSWLRPNGVPAVAWAEIRVPAASASLIESKSLKLYLNSLNQVVFSTPGQAAEVIERDLSSASGSAVSVTLYDVDQPMVISGRPDGFELIDDEPIERAGYTYCPDELQAAGEIVTGRLCSHLLKSNCPVTGQPDWGSLLIEYTGSRISRAGLLRYVVGFRQQQDFHEHCVETMFNDLMQRCDPEHLTVCARYTRRGGLDINPWRSTSAGEVPSMRLIRQ